MPPSRLCWRTSGRARPRRSPGCRSQSRRGASSDLSDRMGRRIDCDSYPSRIAATVARDVSLFGRQLPKGRADVLRRVGSMVESPSSYLHLTGREPRSAYTLAGIVSARNRRGACSAGVGLDDPDPSLGCKRVRRENSQAIGDRTFVLLPVLFVEFAPVPSDGPRARSGRCLAASSGWSPPGVATTRPSGTRGFHSLPSLL